MANVAATSVAVKPCVTISRTWELTAPQLTPPRRFLGFRSPAPSDLAFVPTAGCDGPSLSLPRQRFSPQALPSLPVPLHTSSDRTDSQRSRDADTSPRRSRS